MRGDPAGFFQTSALGIDWRSRRVCGLGRTSILHGDHGNSGRLDWCSHCFCHRVHGSKTHPIKVVSGKWNRNVTPSTRGPSWPRTKSRAGRFYTFVCNTNPERATATAESLKEIRNRNALSDDEWRHLFRGWGGVDGKAVLDSLRISSPQSAAVSGYAKPGVSIRAEIPFTPTFRADRPFICLIRDRDRGTVLFFGRMLNSRYLEHSIRPIKSEPQNAPHQIR